MLKIFKKMNKLLDARQKRIMVVIVFLMLIGGVLESLSISVVIPVVSVLLDPNAIETNELLAAIYNGLRLQNVTQFTVVMLVALIGAFILKNLFLFQRAQLSHL